MSPDFHGTAFLLTASAAGLGGYLLAAMRYAPRIAELAGRLDHAERDLRGQGAALNELSQALRSLLRSLDAEGDAAARIEAMAAARRVLTKG